MGYNSKISKPSGEVETFLLALALPKRRSGLPRMSNPKGRTSDRNIGATLTTQVLVKLKRSES